MNTETDEDSCVTTHLKQVRQGTRSDQEHNKTDIVLGNVQACFCCDKLKQFHRNITIPCCQ